MARLKAAGAIVVGKTNTPEFGAGGNTFNAVFGVTRNPWNLALTCGGSSGGAAVALATGMGPLAYGSDLGGSLRTPAAFCGVVGFRTTPGLVLVYPRELAWDSLSVSGPMARTVSDTALMLSVLAGPDDRAPLSYDVDTRAFPAAVRRPSIRGWRVAWTPDLDGLLPVDPEVVRVAAGATRAFRSLGARVTTASPSFAELNEIVLGTRGLSMVALHADRLASGARRCSRGSSGTSSRASGSAPRHRARGLRSALWQRVRRFMERHDLLVLPTVAVRPFPVSSGTRRSSAGSASRTTRSGSSSYAISVTGLPVISVPAGFTRDGLPVGIRSSDRRQRRRRCTARRSGVRVGGAVGDRIPPVVAGAPAA